MPCTGRLTSGQRDGDISALGFLFDALVNGGRYISTAHQMAHLVLRNLKLDGAIDGLQQDE